jgi:hypothetical protein
LHDIPIISRCLPNRNQVQVGKHKRKNKKKKKPPIDLLIISASQNKTKNRPKKYKAVRAIPYIDRERKGEKEGEILMSS